MSKLSELDQVLAQDYGNYASHPTSLDPVQVETYGDGPAEEVDGCVTAMQDQLADAPYAIRRITGSCRSRTLCAL